MHTLEVYPQKCLGTVKTCFYIGEMYSMYAIAPVSPIFVDGNMQAPARL